MSYHNILGNQINKFLPEKYRQDEAINIFLETISKCYDSFEKDKKITEHAFDVSEREYQIVTQDLHEQNEIRKKSILKLKEAIRSLDPTGPIQFTDEDDVR